MRYKDRRADAEKFYTIGEIIGEGGNARVFEAVDKNTNDSVVIKILKSEDNERTQRFISEINIMTFISGAPGIVPIIKESRVFHWYTMPRLTPIMKWAEVEKNKLVSKHAWEKIDYTPWMRAVIDSFIQIAETLENLHSLGVYHRDIKPDNLYCDKNHALIGDFGLVEFPNNPNNFTREDKGLGAIFTIAPEMKRNPKVGDASKADVYSLAKSIWMVLMGDFKGFEGQYLWNEPLHGLRFNPILKDLYLADLELLLQKSTSNLPADRPTMKEFKQGLIEWRDAIANPNECQKREWAFIQTRIFGNFAPNHTVFKDPKKIIDVLNILANSSALNHMMFSGGGGLDFTGAELAHEEGFIYIFCGSFIHVLKPKALYLETFNDSRWNYYRLEAEVVEPIEGLPMYRSGEQELIEDFPAHYVDASCYSYGVYDYESGTPLPPEAKLVLRYTKGTFLFIMKTCTYNHIHGTYDGRHGEMSNDEFRDYIQSLIDTVNQRRREGVAEEEVLRSNAFNAHPFSDKIEDSRNNHFQESDVKLPDPESFIKKNFKTWNFSEQFPDDSGDGKFSFYFEFILDSWFSPLEEYTKWVLDANGSIREEKEDIKPFELYERGIAHNLLTLLNDSVKEKCIGFDTSSLIEFGYFRIKWRRMAPPSHIFTREEVFSALRNADDRENNVLVIDEDGYAHVIPSGSGFKTDTYPVALEGFGAYNNYVGKYSDSSSYEQHYIDLLTSWRDHLSSGRRIYCDYSRYEPEAGLIEQITTLMNPPK